MTTSEVDVLPVFVAASWLLFMFALAFLPPKGVPAQVRLVDAPHSHEPDTSLQEKKICGRWCLN